MKWLSIELQDKATKHTTLMFTGGDSIYWQEHDVPEVDSDEGEDVAEQD
jgi:hypothetical protein